MNWKLVVGIVLIVLGGAALAFNGVTWYSRKPIIRIATERRRDYRRCFGGLRL